MENVSDKALAQILRNEGTGSAAVEEAADRLESPDLRGHPSTELITKLEQFTIAAMQGLCANPRFDNEQCNTEVPTLSSAIGLAAYRTAQATLEQLAETDT